MLFALISIIALFISLSVHEFCHALAAFSMGDNTARRAGRLTLNPVAHLDPIGTVLIPFMSLLTGFPLIGWAKPVPFNPYNLRFRRWGPTYVALAGPAANFVSALLYAFFLKAALVWAQLPASNLLVHFLIILVALNVLLGLFNFIPVPPLDGSKLLHSILDSPKYRHILFFLETRGPLILLFIIFLEMLSPFSVLGSTFNFVLKKFFAVVGLPNLLGIL